MKPIPERMQPPSSSARKRVWRAAARLAALAALWWGGSSATLAQVQSLTLGIDVNSPYGIREPWVTIRDGLQRLAFVESMSPQPDAATATGELRTRHGQMPDLDVLARALVDTGAGASLRGVEASITGELTREDGVFHLRPAGSSDVLSLQPLTGLVQLGRQATETEKTAYRTLTANWTGRPLRVMVVGPVRHRLDKTSAASAAKGPALSPSKGLTLEVRRFNLAP